mgnify:CR=1 FL=1
MERLPQREDTAPRPGAAAGPRPPAATADVAVVIVTVNALPDIGRNLVELRAQQDVALDVVVIDNGSADGTVELLAEQPDVRLIANGENRWLSPAWAQGVRASDAPYVLFLTPDVELADARLVARLRAALDADPGAALAGPRLEDGEGGDAVNGSFAFPSVRWIVLKRVGLAGVLGRTAKPAPPKVPRTDAHPVAFVNGCCMLVRRSALEGIGGLDETYRLYWEEIDLARRLGAAGHRVLLVPTATAIHRAKGTPTVPGLRERAYRFGERHYVRKHHGAAALAAVEAARLVERLRVALGARA